MSLTDIFDDDQLQRFEKRFKDAKFEAQVYLWMKDPYLLCYSLDHGFQTNGECNMVGGQRCKHYDDKKCDYKIEKELK